MIAQEQKIEQIIAMAGRLMAALQEDIDALAAGHPRKMRFIEPDMLRLSALYAHELKSLGAADGKASPAMRKTLRDTIDAFRDLLKLHMRYLTRVRNATEGLIQAVASDVEKKRSAMRPYVSPRAKPRSPQSTGAMLFNQTI